MGLVTDLGIKNKVYLNGHIQFKERLCRALELNRSLNQVICATKFFVIGHVIFYNDTSNKALR